MRTRRFFIFHLALFVLLSGADLVLTRRLLGQGIVSIYEGNPVAAWFLGRYGWAGLAAFKAAAAAVVVAAVLVIAARRPRVASGVTAFGWAVLAAVTLYSVCLADVHRALGNGTLDVESAGAEDHGRLEDAMGETVRLREFKRRLTDGLVAGHYGFPEAVERLRASEFAREPQRVDALGLLYRLEADRDCWATNLLVFALGSVRGDAERWASLAPAWVAAYREHFRPCTPPPWEWEWVRASEAASAYAR